MWSGVTAKSSYFVKQKVTPTSSLRGKGEWSNPLAYEILPMPQHVLLALETLLDRTSFNKMSEDVAKKRIELIKAAEKKKIKRTVKFLTKCEDEDILRIYKEY